MTRGTYSRRDFLATSLATGAWLVGDRALAQPTDLTDLSLEEAAKLVLHSRPPHIRKRNRHWASSPVNERYYHCAAYPILCSLQHGIERGPIRE